VSYREKLYDHYTAHPSHEWEVGVELHATYRYHMRGWLPPALDEPILDLGCGSGEVLNFLGREGYRRVVGVDRSEPQIERAREKVPDAEVVLGDGLALLRDRPGQFGAVLCFDVLEHLDRDELFEAAECIGAALRPGGGLIARIPNGEALFHDAVRYGDLTHEVGLTPQSLRHLLVVAGFDDVEFRECDPVPKSARGWLRRLLWRGLRQLQRAWNLIEIGSGGSGVYTRVIMVRATVKARDATRGSGS